MIAPNWSFQGLARHNTFYQYNMLFGALAETTVRSWQWREATLSFTRVSPNIQKLEAISMPTSAHRLSPWATQEWGLAPEPKLYVETSPTMSRWNLTHQLMVRTCQVTFYVPWASFYRWGSDCRPAHTVPDPLGPSHRWWGHGKWDPHCLFWLYPVRPHGCRPSQWAPPPRMAPEGGLSPASEWGYSVGVPKHLDLLFDQPTSCDRPVTAHPLHTNALMSNSHNSP